MSEYRNIKVRRGKAIRSVWAPFSVWVSFSIPNSIVAEEWSETSWDNQYGTPYSSDFCISYTGAWVSQLWIDNSFPYEIIREHWGL